MADQWDSFSSPIEGRDPWASFSSPVDKPKNWLATAATPITSYPAEYDAKRKAAQELMGSGVGDITGEGNLGTKALGVGKAALGALGYLYSPATAAVTSLVGKPVEKAIGIPHDYTDFAAELLIPGMGLTKVPRVAAPTAAKETLEAFERSKVTPTIPSVSQNRGVGTTAKVIGDTIAGTPIERATGKQFGEASARANELADTLSNVGDTATAGERAQQGAETFVNKTSKATQNRAYQRVGNISAGTTMPETQTAISRIESRISNPAIRKLVTDSNFVRVADAVKDAAKNGGLSFDDLRELRSQVRLLRPAEGSVTGINKTAVDALYGGLTRDMHTLAYRAGGPSALHAVRAADRYTRALETIQKPALQKLLDAKGGEDAFRSIARMANKDAGADWRNLAKVKHSIGPQAWNDVSATLLRKLGEPVPSASGLAKNANFSPETFTTNWNKLSERGKNMLFGGQQAPLRRAMDDLVKVVGELKRVERLGNPSGSGRYGTMAAMIPAGIANLPATLGVVAGGHVAARILSNPKYVRWLVNVGTAIKNRNKTAITLHMRKLPTLAAGDSEALDALSKTVFGGASPARADQDQQ